jgi:3-isopropylmalate dehydratase small subunit
MALMWS